MIGFGYSKQERLINESGLFLRSFYLTQYTELELGRRSHLWHFLHEGWREMKDPHPLFHVEHYLRCYPDVAKSGLNPLIHFLERGFLEGRFPNPLFDPNYYFAKNNNVLQLGENPLVHFIKSGWREFRDPHPDFSVKAYLEQNPDCLNSWPDPLSSYLQSLSKNKSISQPASITKALGQTQIKENFESKKCVDKNGSDFNSPPPNFHCRAESRKQRLESFTFACQQYQKWSINSDWVSIIILNLNGLKELKTLIPSILDHTIYSNYEILVMDNGSTDDSLTYLSKFKQIKLIKNETNETFSIANNRASKLARGNYLVFLNNDTEVTRGWLTELIGCQKKHKACCVGPKLVYPVNDQKPELSLKIQQFGIKFREEKDYIRPYNWGQFYPYDAGILENPCEFPAITGACLLIRKTDFMDLGGFDECYNYGYEDVDLGLKAHAKGLKNRICPSSLVYHYEFGTQSRQPISEVNKRNHKNYAYFKQKWFKYLSQAILRDKIKGFDFFTNRYHLNILMVGHVDKHRPRQDIPSQPLAGYLRQMGYQVNFIYEEASQLLDVGLETDLVLFLDHPIDIDRCINYRSNVLLMQASQVSSPNRIDRTDLLDTCSRALEEKESISVYKARRLELPFDFSSIQYQPEVSRCRRGEIGLESQLNHLANQVKVLQEKVDVMSNAFREQIGVSQSRINLLRKIKRRLFYLFNVGSERTMQNNIRRILGSGLFDPGYYLKTNLDLLFKTSDLLRHFLTVGYKELRSPHPLFDVAFYLESHPDVRAADANPLIHFLTHGHREGRNPHPLFQTEYYRRQVGKNLKGMNPLSHFLKKGWQEGLSPSALFDVPFYLSSNKDVAKARINPVLHFLINGWVERRNPNAYFDTNYYLETYPDVSSANVNPLLHFVCQGYKEGRNPSAYFNTQAYLESYGELITNGPDPLTHFIEIGKDMAKKKMTQIGHGEALLYQNSEPRSCSYFSPKGRLDAFVSWQLFNGPNPRKHDYFDRLVQQSNVIPLKFSIIIPVFNPELDILKEAVESVLHQTFQNWELILVDDASTKPGIKECLESYRDQDPRIKLRFNEENRHISYTTNQGAEWATGDFLVFLDNDDKLDLNALLLFAHYIGANPKTDLIFSDDAKINTKGKGLMNPKFKPGWSPELLLSYCYISHLKAVRTSVYRQIEGSRLGFEGSQDHDMLLRASEVARHIGHVPQILYHRRVLETSTALTGHAKPYTFEAGRRAVEEAFERRNVKCRVIHPDWAFKAGVGIFVPQMPDKGPSVAIIIPTKNKWGILDRLLISLKKTTYKNYKVYIIDNDSDDEETLDYLRKVEHKILKISSPNGAFNFAYINNRAAECVNEELLLFLNNDTEVITPNWLSQMVGWSRLEGVGAVGARLLFPDGRVQHGGVVMGLKEGLTAFRGLPGDQGGYLWYAKVTRNVSAVTAAAMLTPRGLFEEVGGFDEERFAVAYNDVDYCLRLKAHGKRMVYCGEAELYHYEGFTRNKGDNPSEIANLKSMYQNYVDDLYSPHLSLDNNRHGIKPYVHPIGKPKTPINVLGVTHNLNHEGAPNSAFELLTGLHKNGIIKPTIVSPQDGPLRKKYQDEGIEVLILDRPRPNQNLMRFEDFENRLAHVMEQIDFESFDLVYANTVTTFWAIECAYRKNIPTIWNIRESESWKDYFSNFPSDVARKALECFAYPYRVVFVARKTRQRWSPVDRVGNFEVIHNGIDINRLGGSITPPDRNIARKSLGVADNDFVILSVGTISPRKAQWELIQATEFLFRTHKKVRLFLVGARENEYLRELKNRFDSFPLDFQQRVSFIKERADITQFWNASDLFAFSSRLESYPRVILEAMAKGLPIVTTPVFGVCEQVRDGLNGLYYQSGNIEDLKDKIETVMEDVALRRKYAAAQSEMLRSLESYPSMLYKYGQIFKSAYFSSSPKVGP